MAPQVGPLLPTPLHLAVEDHLFPEEEPGLVLVEQYVTAYERRTKAYVSVHDLQSVGIFLSTRLPSVTQVLTRRRCVAVGVDESLHDSPGTPPPTSHSHRPFVWEGFTETFQPRYVRFSECTFNKTPPPLDVLSTPTSGPVTKNLLTMKIDILDVNGNVVGSLYVYLDDPRTIYVQDWTT